MPELPDLTVYLEHLESRIGGERMKAIRLASPFLLRTVTPSVEDVCGHRVTACSRLAKQLVIALESDYYLVLHLMIAGRLHWQAGGKAIPKRNGLAAFDFDSGTLIFTEASKKKRASLRLVHGAEDLAALDPGGLEVLDIDLGQFADQLNSTNHTLKRALTDHHVLAGIGNTYSDEILLRPLSDRWPAAGGPLAVAPAEGQLAPASRRSGVAATDRKAMSVSRAARWTTRSPGRPTPAPLCTSRAAGPAAAGRAAPETSLQ